jgi:hypothetical protein
MAPPITYDNEAWDGAAYFEWALRQFEAGIISDVELDEHKRKHEEWLASLSDSTPGQIAECRVAIAEKLRLRRLEG